MKINKVYNQNFFEAVNNIDDESIDLIICDGPYGITSHEWDKINDIQQYNLNLIKIFSRILKKGGALYLFGKPNLILDPFAGSGTSLVVCKKFKRNFIGFELNSNYVNIINKRLNEVK